MPSAMGFSNQPLQLWLAGNELCGVVATFRYGRSESTIHRNPYPTVYAPDRPSRAVFESNMRSQVRHPESIVRFAAVDLSDDRVDQFCHTLVVCPSLDSDVRSLGFLRPRELLDGEGWIAFQN